MDKDVTIENRQARHKYIVAEQYEAGMVLTGSEVKSLRSGQVDIAHAYAVVGSSRQELYLKNAFFAPFQSAKSWGQHKPTRVRKLLLHRHELNRVVGKSRQAGAALVPLRMYFNSRGKAKLLLGLVKGKRQVDKRRSIKEREWKRRKQRLISALVWVGFVFASSGSSLANHQLAAFEDYKQTLARKANQEYDLSISEAQRLLAEVDLSERSPVRSRNEQPEFIYSYRYYLQQRTTIGQIVIGRKHQLENARLLDQIEKKYKISRHILIALWGIESTFGSNMGRYPLLSTLVNAGFNNKRRQTFFEGQAIGALYLLTELTAHNSAITAQSLMGSWSGASGHFQFIPTTWIQYRQDWNRDGIADIWTDFGDALASAAYFLSRLGWKAEERWGRLVAASETADLIALAKLINQRKKLSQWSELSLTQPDGRVLLHDSVTQARLVAPDGIYGPLYLVYRNLEVLLRWNRSYLFALSVSHLADLMKGQDTRPNLEHIDEPFSSQIVSQIQSKLGQLGYPILHVDGVLGSETKQAIKLWQEKHGYPADGALLSNQIEAILQTKN